MKYVTDENGNRASIEYFGSQEAAENSLKTLKNCINCTDCHDCISCISCNICNYYNYCHDCRNCTDCTDCTDCRRIKECKNSLIIGGFRSDNYQFVMSESGSIHAGCRVFENITEARKHWIETRENTKLGDETFILLDVMEKLYEMRK